MNIVKTLIALITITIVICLIMYTRLNSKSESESESFTQIEQVDKQVEQSPIGDLDKHFALHDILLDIKKTNTYDKADQNLSSPADFAIANRMLYNGSQAKRAMDIRRNFNRNSLAYLYEEDLRENEAKDWWDNENDHLDNFM